MLANQHAIAAGWDADPGDLDLITSLVDSYGEPLPPPRAIGTFNPGLLEPRGDFSITVAGVAAVRWEWDQIERVFRKIIREAYIGTSIFDHSAQVTIKSPIEDPAEYFLCNAYLYLDPITQLDYQGDADWYTRFALRFVIEEILDTP